MKSSPRCFLYQASHLFLPILLPFCLFNFPSRVKTKQQLFLGGLLPLNFKGDFTNFGCTSSVFLLSADFLVMAEKVGFKSAGQQDEEVFHPESRSGARIRFGSRDEESGRRRSRSRDALPLGRTATNASQSSVRSTASSRRRRYSVDPATALPITFRTVSYAIEETKEKERVEAVKTKKDVATEFGDLEWHTWSVNEVENRLETSIKQGLSSEQVTRKQKEFGKNAPSKPPSDLFSRLVGYMFGGFGSVLLTGGILVTITYK